MTFDVVIIIAIREKENKKKKRTVRGGLERVKKDDESIACQVSVGFFFSLSISKDIVTLYKFIYSVFLYPHTRCKKKIAKLLQNHSKNH
jgi:hypothetical protein